jgi:hypothetical protein
MQTTLNLPDALYQKSEALAASRGATVEQFIVEAAKKKVQSLPLIGFEDLFPQADRFGRHFDHFVVADELDGLLQIQQRGGTRRMASSAVEARMLVSFFSLTMLTSRSASRVLADDHAFVNFGRGRTKISPRSCRLKMAWPVVLPARSATSEPVGRIGNLALPIDVAVEQRIHDRRAARIGEDLAAQPIRPREGTWNSSRTRPEPLLTILLILPLRAPSFSITTPRKASGQSMTSSSSGSIHLAVDVR